MENLSKEMPKGLVFSCDSETGFTRKRAGKGYAFYDDKGKLIKDEKVRERLNQLAIPPAYKEVWYCKDTNGHLQATGLDSKDRKQYRYHEKWSDWRNLQKFDSLLEFADALPKIRRRVARGLTGKDLDKERVLCGVVRLLDKTAARIGNEAYYQENGSTGLTTLREKNIKTEDGHLLLHYIAKGGKDREFDIYQPNLVKIVDQLHDLPGQRLFQYEGVDGKLHPVTSSDVNEWLKDVSGIEISAKDFRTWHASELCLNYFLGRDEPQADSERVSLEVEVLKLVSEELGHRPPVCKKHYVHPEILELQRNGKLKRLCGKVKTAEISELSSREVNFVGFLKKLS